jgi:hypothetical protein
MRNRTAHYSSGTDIEVSFAAVTAAVPEPAEMTPELKKKAVRTFIK